MRDSPEQGKLDPVIDNRRPRKKNSSVLSFIDRGQKKVVIVETKLGQFTTG